MPQTPERKREYMRDYMAKRRGGKSERGVSPYLLVPPLEKESVSPSPIPMNPQTMTKRRLVDYLAHIGQRGFSLVLTSRGYELVAVGCGQLVSFDSVAIIEGQLRAQGQRITQLEADLARIEVMMDSMLREGDLS